MKLKNKKTGEVVDIPSESITIETLNSNNKMNKYEYDSISDIHEDWEDYEEPEEHWFIGEDGNAHIIPSDHYIFTERAKAIGNYFETEEEAERAVEKLKAWKRLKDKGFEFICWDYGETASEGSIDFRFSEDEINERTSQEDFDWINKCLDTLLGGEDE